MQRVKSSILVSLFERKGGEGIYTKVISKHDLDDNLVLSNLKKNESGLILYYKTEKEWFLLTNERIISDYKGSFINLYINDIKEVTIAISEEFSNGIRNKKDFSKLRIIDTNEVNYLLHLEKGLPYEGIYQVLHYIASKK